MRFLVAGTGARGITVSSTVCWLADTLPASHSFSETPLAGASFQSANLLYTKSFELSIGNFVFSRFFPQLF
jgi:hypothetical protein